MLRRINKEGYSNYIKNAEECVASRVFPLSIAAGFQSGDIYADDKGCVMFWHYCGFVFLTGNITDEVLEEIYNDFLTADTSRRFIIITDSEYVKTYYETRGNLQFEGRINYTHSSPIKPQELSDGSITVERITADNIGMIKGRIIPSSAWENEAQFLENGFGFVARQGDVFAGVAFSSAVSPDETDIGIETGEAFRHKGLASYLSYKMCEEIKARGKTPTWTHVLSNEGSRKTALRVGFEPVRRNIVIQKET